MSHGYGAIQTYYYYYYYYYYLPHIHVRSFSLVTAFQKVTEELRF